MPPTFDPRNFLVVAQRLAAPGADEAALRTAIGRGYYAMFLLARDGLGITTTVQAHGEVVRVLTRRRKSLGDQLFALFNLRRLADYELAPEDLSVWQARWTRASHIIAALQPALERLP